MSDGKWISGLTATTPLEKAARLTLGARLQVVEEKLKCALRAPEKDIEYIHHLRVGTRRAVAALDIFSSTLPVKEYRRARKKLRRLRRAAGLARDWDVFSLTVTERSSKPLGSDFLLGYAQGQRAAAQAHLEAAGEEFPAGFEAFASAVLDSIHAPVAGAGTKVLLDLARPMLSDLLGKLHESASADLEVHENLHRLRIDGKQLRYAMELFVDCFGNAFRDKHYPAIEEMQDILGPANDSRVAILRLESLRARLRQAFPDEWRKYKPAIDDLLRFHRRRLPRQRHRFHRWWKHWQSSNAETEFGSLLNSPEFSGVD